MQSQQYRPNQFSLLPVVVKNLLILNGLFFLATITLQGQLGFDLADKLGLHYPLSEKFRPYQLITYMFMHGSFGHLFFNMFALWMFGNSLENVWGPKRFLTYYIITGIGAAICHYAVVYFQFQPTLEYIDYYLANPSIEEFHQFIRSEHFKKVSEEVVNNYNEYIPTYYQQAIAENNTSQALQISIDYMHRYRADFLNAPVIIGASGSVFGILLAFGMMFPNTLLYLYFAIPIKAKWFVILYGLAELMLGLKGGADDNVAHFAHLGGMLFGIILIRYWKRKNWLH